MELSEQQYNQIIRYVEDEMEPSEKQAFEAALLQDSELAEEVQGYKETRLVAAGVQQKLCGLDVILTKEKNNKAEVWNLLQQERQQWEQQHEEMFRQEHGLTISKTNITPREQGKVLRMNRQKWLMAAVIIGIICLGSVIWWYGQEETVQPDITIQPKEPNTGAKDQQIDKSENKIHPDTTSPKQTVPSSNTTDPSTNLAQQSAKDRSAREKSYQLNKIEREALYASNFQPDGLPEDKPDGLKEAFTHYETGVYPEAIASYKKTLTDPQIIEEDQELTRDENGEKERTRFYAHYYLAQSYLVINHSAEAITELKKALQESPTIYWQCKAEWYLALAYLKAGQRQKTQTLLQQVINNDPSGEYKLKAMALSRQLKKT